MPDCECEEGEAAAGQRAPPMARCACGRDGLPKIAGACDNPASGSGVMFFLGMSHERSVSSRPLSLSLFECFTPFLPSSRQSPNASTSLTALVSSGARGYDHRGESTWKAHERAERRKGAGARGRQSGDGSGGRVAAATVGEVSELERAGTQDRRDGAE